MADDLPTDGGGLRAKLEEALAENGRLKQENKVFQAESLIREHGLTLVSPEDLATAPREDMETRALELQQQALEQRESTVRSLFVEKGLSGDELDAAVASVLDGSVRPAASTEGNSAAVTSARELGRVGGEAPAQFRDWDSLSPLEKIKAGIQT